jgi:hypothetical protein
MRVEVYRNLHTGTWSLRHLEGWNKGKVVDHPDTVRIDNASFVVQPAGNVRVRSEGKKNVHAFVRGEFVWSSKGGGDARYPEYMRRASYNPYENTTFVDRETSDPVTEAGMVILDIHSGVWYAPSNNNNEVN